MRCEDILLSDPSGRGEDRASPQVRLSPVPDVYLSSPGQHHAVFITGSTPRPDTALLEVRLLNPGQRAVPSSPAPRGGHTARRATHPPAALRWLPGTPSWSLLSRLLRLSLLAAPSRFPHLSDSSGPATFPVCVCTSPRPPPTSGPSSRSCCPPTAPRARPKGHELNWTHPEQSSQSSSRPPAPASLPGSAKNTLPPWIFCPEPKSALTPLSHTPCPAHRETLLPGLRNGS